MAAARSKKLIWLIGHPEDRLPSNVLPTTGDILKYFFNLRYTENNDVEESTEKAVENLMTIWVKANTYTY